MDKEELYEEIRAILYEAQVNTVEKAWNYDDLELARQVRSALRNLRALGLRIEADLTPEGTLTTAPTEEEGVLISYFVAERLLSGDLLYKLQQGELGLYFRAGMDVIDTKDAGKQFASKARELKQEFDTRLAIALTNATAGPTNVFGDPGISRVEGGW